MLPVSSFSPFVKISGDGIDSGGERGADGSSSVIMGCGKLSKL